MSEQKIYGVPAEVAAGAHLDGERYREMYQRSVDDPEGILGRAGG